VQLLIVRASPEINMEAIKPKEGEKHDNYPDTPDF